MNTTFFPLRQWVLRAVVAGVLGVVAIEVGAAVTDISNSPMASGGSAEIKPNIMFILDDSGSMGWSYLPDAAGNFDSGEYGSNSKHCNGVYYNPAVTYTPPVDSTGITYPDASFSAARSNGFDPNSSPTNLKDWFYYAYTGNEADLAFTYNTDGSVKTTSTFYKECNSDIGSTPGKNVFTKVTLTSASAEAQNFANWYSYYRTRMLTMKTAAGRAFKNIGDTYRVGYSTISYTGVDSTNSGFLQISDLIAAQKNSLYEKIYKAAPGGFTPLRGALSKAGQIYAGKLLTGANDPVQYSCQQNFTILSTDGYWNTNDETATYKALQMDGATLVGNQDGTGTPLPMLDALNKSNTLADVAMYYYKTDLRTSSCTSAGGNDICMNNVPGSGGDTATHQHMTTFTLGLGVDGTLQYAEDYVGGGSADFNAIVNGTLNWPDPIANDGPQRIDDLWHAAVNGRGTYFSAKSPDSLVSGLSKALSGVTARTGAAAAAATSNLEPVTGDNFAYVAMYQTVKWDGDLLARFINLDTGTVSEISDTGGNKICTDAEWCASALLDTKADLTSDSRTIYTYNKATGKIKDFTVAGLATEIADNYFDPCSASNPNGVLSQCATMSTTDKAVATSTTIINYIRGWSGYEDQAGNTYRIYRDREHVLGDIVHSQPVYVKKPMFNYGDSGYATFKDNNATRTGVVYVGANDGMLHAFDSATGQEKWAYIPSVVVPTLYKLADKAYSANHRYYVDGSITVGDVCKSPCSAANDWITILVGGLNKGGRGYYALDITDPENPKVLWEVADENMGYSYGNPVITKNKAGTWVVMLTSGYNNVPAANGGPENSTTGDGIGRLYIRNAISGASEEIISTGIGGVATPSGLSKINNWVDSTLTDNTTKRIYGGDLLGNLWRFDPDNTTGTGNKVFKLAAFGDSKPITTKPELGEVSSAGYAVVYVGTGRYLGVDDLTNIDQQTFYAIKDDLTAATPDLTNLVSQTLSSSGNTRTIINPAGVSWATDPGWKVDFNPGGDSPGERVTVDPKLQLGSLVVATNIPDNNACNIGGYSWLYFFDYKTGSFMSTADGDQVGQKVGNALIVGTNVVRLPNGKTVAIITTSDNKHPVLGVPPQPADEVSRRAQWRELMD